MGGGLIKCQTLKIHIFKQIFLPEHVNVLKQIAS